MSSAIPQVCWFADALESCIQFSKRSDMGSADFDFLSSNEVDLLMIRNIVFTFGKVRIFVVVSYKMVNVLIFRNCVFILRNVQRWAEPNCKVVYLLIVRNSVCRLRNVPI